MKRSAFRAARPALVLSESTCVVGTASSPLLHSAQPVVVSYAGRDVSSSATPRRVEGGMNRVSRGNGERVVGGEGLGAQRCVHGHHDHRARHAVPATPPYRVGVLAPAEAKPIVKMRCPACGHQGTLEASGLQDLRDGELHPTLSAHFVVRRCPNPDCFAAIFVVCSSTGEVLVAHPAEVIDFDASDLPPAVLSAFQEAVKCHAAGCYRAAAVMVRRTLEEVCAEQGARGTNLYERVEDLGRKVTLPKGFLEGLHDLRMLGNDAVHLELKDFDRVDSDEAEDAIMITKILLQPLYQFGSIMARLAERKKQAGQTA